jgi:uncharacterized protein (TIGR03086 family)
MLTPEILDRAASGFAATRDQVADDQWESPTGNDGQNVGQLVDHVIGGNRMAAVILGGGSRTDGMAAFARSADDDDPISAFAQSRLEQAGAFAEPGALERIVHHPAMDMPGAQLLGFRTVEYALHGWDLARAIGADDQIDPIVVDEVWALLVATAPMLAASGMFGTGPSGTLGDDAPLQDRMLDISGRRP